MTEVEISKQQAIDVVKRDEIILLYYKGERRCGFGPHIDGLILKCNKAAAIVDGHFHRLGFSLKLYFDHDRHFFIETDRFKITELKNELGLNLL